MATNGPAFEIGARIPHFKNESSDDNDTSSISEEEKLGKTLTSTPEKVKPETISNQRSRSICVPTFKETVRESSISSVSSQASTSSVSRKKTKKKRRKNKLNGNYDPDPNVVKELSSIKFPLEDNYDFRLSCSFCLVKPKKIGYNFAIRSPCANCKMDTLTVKKKSRKHWAPIRMRPECGEVFSGFYKICNDYKTALECHLEPCTFAHGKAEQDLWALEIQNKFHLEGFIQKLKKNKITSTEMLRKIQSTIQYIPGLSKEKSSSGLTPGEQPAPSSTNKEIVPPSHHSSPPKQSEYSKLDFIKEKPSAPVSSDPTPPITYPDYSDHYLQAQSMDPNIPDSGMTYSQSVAVTKERVNPALKTVQVESWPLESDQNPLASTHDFRMFCSTCFPPKSREPPVHECEKNILAFAEKGTADWLRVRERSRSQVFDRDYILCKSLMEEPEQCQRGKEHCTFAHNTIEQLLWSADKHENFDLSQFILSHSKAPYEITNFVRKYGNSSFSFICGECFKSIKEPVYQNERNPLLCNSFISHQWNQSKILYYKSESIVIKKRPFLKNGKRYWICFNKLCHQDNCTFAHSMIERNVWILQRSLQLSDEEFLEQLVKQPKSSLKTDLAQIPCCPYKLEAVCELCYMNGQKKKHKECGHSKLSSKTLYLTLPGKKRIHKLPQKIPKNFYFQICWSMKNNKCKLPDCTFAHSEEEIKIWKWMCHNNIKTLEDCLQVEEKRLSQVVSGTSSIFQGAAPVVNDSATPHRCVICDIYFTDQLDWENHCTTPEHKANVTCDREQLWNFREPPWNSIKEEDLKFCEKHKRGQCLYSNSLDMYNLCMFAHDPKELEEWQKRFKWRKLRSDMAKSHTVMNYISQVQEKSTKSSEMMRENIPGIKLKKTGKNKFTSMKKNTDYTWTFKVETENHNLKKVALLHDHDRLYFKMKSYPQNKDVQVLEASQCQKIGNEWNVSVYFQSNIYGSFNQRIIFDFGIKSCLYQDLQVDLGSQKSLRKIENLRKDNNFKLWTPENMEIFKLGAEDKLEKMYKKPNHIEKIVTVDLVDSELNQHNYVYKMHKLLELEEYRRQQKISRYNLCGKMAISEIILDDSGLRKSPEKTLFGRLVLTDELSAETDIGQLILTSCQSVFISSRPSGNKAYEVEIVKESNFDFKGLQRNHIYLHLTESCIQGLKFKKDEEKEVEIQFQFYRFSFCLMHFALDYLTTIDLVFPDPAKNIMSTPATCRSSILNENQIVAVNYILSQGKPYLCPFILNGAYGTGKTETLVQATMELLDTQLNCKILICTQCNSSADLFILKHLDEYVTKKNKSPKIIVRSHYTGRHIYSVPPTILKYSLLANGTRSFRSPQHEDIRSARVVITTLENCYNLINLQLKGTFTHIFIDEAAQDFESKVLLPLTMATEKTAVVLSGDHHQMGIKIYSPEAHKQGLGKSIIQRLYEHYSNHPFEKTGNSDSPLHTLLVKNYRSVREITEFIHKCFYGEIFPSTEDLPPAEPGLKPLQLYAVHGKEEVYCNSTSYFNEAEVQQVSDSIIDLKTNWPQRLGAFDPKDVCVVSCFRDQVVLIRKHLRKLGQNFGQIIVEQIGNVPGKEFKVVIISTVRTYHNLDITADHLANYHRDIEETDFFCNKKLLNSAMTRAKYSVIAVGDPVALCAYGKCATIWRIFLSYCSKLCSVKPRTITYDLVRYEVSSLLSSREKTGGSLLQEKEGVEDESQLMEEPVEHRNGDTPLQNEGRKQKTRINGTDLSLPPPHNKGSKNPTNGFVQQSATDLPNVASSKETSIKTDLTQNSIKPREALQAEQISNLPKDPQCIKTKINLQKPNLQNISRALNEPKLVTLNNFEELQAQKTPFLQGAAASNLHKDPSLPIGKPDVSTNPFEGPAVYAEGLKNLAPNPNPATTQNLTLNLNPNPNQAKTPNLALNITPHQAKPQNLTLNPNPAQTPNLSLTPTPNQAKLQNLTLNPNPARTPILSLTPTPNQAKPQNLTLNPNPARTPILSLTPTPNQAKPQNLTLNPNPAQTPNLSLNPTPNQAKLQNLTLNPNPARTPNLSLTPTPNQAKPQNLTLNPNPARTPNLSLNPTPNQAKPQNLTLNPNPAQTPILSLNPTPNQAKPQNLTLNPNPAQTPILSLNPTPNQAKPQNLTLNPNPARTLNLSLTPTPNQAKPQNLTLNPNPAQTPILSLNPTPNQAKPQNLTLNPNPAQTPILSLNPTPNQAKLQNLTLNPNPTQTPILSLNPTPNQAKPQNLTLNPNPARTLNLSLNPTPNQAKLQNLTLNPNPTQTRILSLNPTPNQAKPQNLTLNPNPAQTPILSLNPTPNQAKLQNLTLNPNPAQTPILSLNPTPNQAKPQNLTLNPNPTQTPNLSLNPTPNQAKLQNLTLNPNPARTPNLTLSPNPARTEVFCLTPDGISLSGFSKSDIDSIFLAPSKTDPKDFFFPNVCAIQNQSEKITIGINILKIDKEFILGIHWPDVQGYLFKNYYDKFIRSKGNISSIDGTILPHLPLNRFALNLKTSAVSCFLKLNPRGQVLDCSFLQTQVKPAYLLQIEDLEEKLGFAAINGELCFFDYLQELTKEWRQIRLGNESLYLKSTPQDSRVSQRLLKEILIQLHIQVVRFLSKAYPGETPIAHLSLEPTDALQYWKTEHLSDALNSVSLHRPFLEDNTCKCKTFCRCLLGYIREKDLKSSIEQTLRISTKTWNRLLESINNGEFEDAQDIILSPSSHSKIAVAHKRLLDLSRLELKCTDGDYSSYSVNFDPGVYYCKPIASTLDLLIQKMIVAAIKNQPNPVSVENLRQISVMSTEALKSKRTAERAAFFKDQKSMLSNANVAQIKDPLMEVTSERVAFFKDQKSTLLDIAVETHATVAQIKDSLMEVTSERVAFFKDQKLTLSDIAVETHATVAQIKDSLMEVIFPELDFWSCSIDLNMWGIVNEQDGYSLRFSQIEIDISNSSPLHQPGEKTEESLVTIKPTPEYLIKAFDWQNILSCLRSHNFPALKDRVRSTELSINNESTALPNNVRNTEVFYKLDLHTYLNIEASVKILEDQDGQCSPELQSFQLTPDIYLCVQHRKSPLKYFLPDLEISLADYQKELLTKVYQLALASPPYIILRNVKILNQNHSWAFKVPLSFLQENETILTLKSGVDNSLVPMPLPAMVCIRFSLTPSKMTRVFHGYVYETEDSVSDVTVRLKVTDEIQSDLLVLSEETCSVEIICWKKTHSKMVDSIFNLTKSSSLAQKIMKRQLNPVKPSTSIYSIFEENEFSVVQNKDINGSVLNLLKWFEEFASHLYLGKFNGGTQVLLCTQTEDELDIVENYLKEYGFLEKLNIVRLADEHRERESCRSQNGIYLHEKLHSRKQEMLAVAEMYDITSIEQEEMFKQANKEFLSNSHVILSTYLASKRDVLRTTSIKQILFFNADSCPQVEALILISFHPIDRVGIFSVLQENPSSFHSIVDHAKQFLKETIITFH